MASFTKRLSIGIAEGFRAFRKAALQSGFDNKEYGDWDSRKLRYEIYWSMFENSIFSDIKTWSKTYKSTHGLYRYIRSIYSPANRLASFWQENIFGGKLDPAAGEDPDTAIPILMEEGAEEIALRAAIGLLWRHSNWAVNKDILSLWGTVHGDSFIKIIDDPQKGRVHLDIIHPGIVREIEIDEMGFVQGYLLEEERPDPRSTRSGKMVTFNEEVTRGTGDAILFRTFLDGEPFAWNNLAHSWETDYGFIPFIKFQHNDVGQDWGWSEFHAGRGKFQEADDIASALHDQIRKIANPVWLFSGVKGKARGKTSNKIEITRSDPSISNPQKGREEMPSLFGPVGASATPLLASAMPIGPITSEIKFLLQEIERDYPELKTDAENVSGDMSGKAIRENRKKTENKASKIRSNYHVKLVQAHQMAISIGGGQNYEGYEAFDLDSFEDGKSAHSIRRDDIFAIDPVDAANEEKAFWEAADIANRAGLDLLLYLEFQGWPQDKIKQVADSEKYQAVVAAREALAATGNGPGNFPGKETEEDDETEEE